MLQRGRSHVTAESSPNRTRNDLRHHCFNGAAVWWTLAAYAITEAKAIAIASTYRRSVT